MLQLYDTGDGHLHAAEHCDHLQDLVIERRGCKGLEGPALELTSAPSFPEHAPRHAHPSHLGAAALARARQAH